MEGNDTRTGIWRASVRGRESDTASPRFVKSRDLVGTVRIGLRLHRAGIGDVFDLSSYETYYSDDAATGTTDWKAIEVTTPEIDPPPDRMHLLLEMDGGDCWFDDVIFERNV